MFKKGVITDEISQDFKRAVDLSLKYGLDGVEIRSVWDKGPHQLEFDDIRKIKAILTGTQLKVCCISSPFFKCNINDPGEIKMHKDILVNSIELAHKLNTRYVRGFTFWNRGSFEENFDRIISEFEEPVKVLEREDIVLVLENEPSVFTTNAAKVVRVIQKLNSPNIKALWDPGNDVYDPDEEIPYPEGYEIIKPYMLHMHFKDAIKLPDGKVNAVPTGEGQVDYKRQIQALKEDGYEGYVVLETHYRPKHEVDKKIMALPSGSAFSYLGYEATEECLQKWERLSGNA